MLRSVLTGFLGVLTCLAHTPADMFEKAPPQVDEALRARIRKFYQAHVDGKFRVADEVVAEESKDVFFAAEKRKFQDFQIVKVSYTDNFTRAKVIVSCGTELLVGNTRMPTKMPVVSSWKLIDGNWYWYVEPPPPVPERDSPFGMMRAGPGPGAVSQGASAAGGTPNLSSLMRAVKPDKTEVRLSGDGAVSDSVLLLNEMPGPVTLSVDNPFKGLETKVENAELKAGQSGKVGFRCTPGDNRPKQPVTVHIVVNETGQRIPVHVTFTAGPVR